MAYNLEKLDPFLSLPEPYKCDSCPYCNGTRDPTPRFKNQKPEPWTWWKDNLKSPKYAVAPMVDQSELPFRMLCRKYGATLAYTPMFHAGQFAQSAEYRRREFSTCPEDRPLFVQFCGHDGDTVLAAAKHVETQCDAVDLNLGCPQGIAKKGNYGSFLMEKWDVIHTILHTLTVELSIPVTAKMRVFDDLDLTLRYARMLRDTGIHLLTVHGRTREMKGQQTGLADLDKIAAVKKEITNIPVLANGNILQFSDIAPNLEKTGCQGVLSAEALLWDPRLFADVPNYLMNGRMFVASKSDRLAGIATAKEYMQLAMTTYPCPAAWVKAHLFKMLHHSFEVHPEFRPQLAAIGNENGDQACMVRQLEYLQKVEEAEKICDVDLYSKKHPRQEQHSEQDARIINDNASSAAAASSSSCCDAGDDDKNGNNNNNTSSQQPQTQLQLQQKQAVGNLAPGCRRMQASADYASQIDDGFGDFFS